MSAAQTPVVLDCDPGHDDAMAILLAAASPRIDLRAVTTVAGNQTLEKTTLNARRVCTVAGIRDVPIAAGADRPLARPLEVAADIHGESGLDGPEWPEPTVALDPRHAVEVIADAAAAAERSAGAHPRTDDHGTDERGTDGRGGLTLIAVGPLTNVALALRNDQALARRLARLVLMGGAIGLGNHTPSAEFNIWADPEAADEVFRSGVPIVMVPLEVTHQALATPERLAPIDAIGTPLARTATMLMRFFTGTYQQKFAFPAPAVHDPCAVCWAIDRSIVPTRPMHVEIETRSELTRGRTDVDVHAVRRRDPNAEVAVDLDVDRFWSLLTAAIAAYGSGVRPGLEAPAAPG